MSVVQPIRSRDNPLLQRLRRLGQDGNAYRRLGQLWVEGEHLCRAALAGGWTPAQAVLSESAWAHGPWRELAERAPRVAVLPDGLFGHVSALEAPTGLGFLLALPDATGIDGHAATVVLDRLQDPGNAGSILRSAAALGVRQVLALKGTVALWSPKVLRAGMGAHFRLALVEGLAAEALAALAVPLLATSSHEGQALGEVALPSPCAWLFGQEGQGVEPALLQRAALRLRIPQPGGEESLNVAAAAAICLYESARSARHAAPGAAGGQ